MDNLHFFLSIFWRRLPYFLVVATLASAISIIVATTLPPAYVSHVRLLVESPQIPTNLAASTVNTPAMEQLQIVEQRLLTRSNMLDIARRLNVLLEQDKMSPDEIVRSMRVRTNVSSSTGRNQATLMTIYFEAPDARNAANVLNEYLNVIQQLDVEFRRDRAVGTLEFFQQEVARLDQELAEKSARILKFKKENADALPSTLNFRLNQQTTLQQRLAQIDQEIANLRTQAQRLVQVFQETGQVQATQGANRSPEQQQLDDLNQQLNQALVVYSESNPNVRMLRARIRQVEDVIAAQTAAQPADKNPSLPRHPMLDIQLADIESRLSVLQDQKKSVEKQLKEVSDSVARTPANDIALASLDRDYQNIQTQYNNAVARLASASTGERIEGRSRGQRISVIEQPAVPTEPTKPNRMMIAGGGTAMGMLAGLGLIVLLELLNKSARRPEDIVKKLGITPIASVPYIHTRGQVFAQRGMKIGLILLILIGIPAAIFAVHTYYQPLDLIAERVMNKLGVRW